MRTRPIRSLALTLLLALGAFACADVPVGPESVSLRPVSALSSGSIDTTLWARSVFVCSSGTSANFKVSLNAGAPTSTSVAYGSCELVHTQPVGADVHNTVTVTEDGSASSTLDSIMVETTRFGLVQSTTILKGTSTASVLATWTKGGIVTFFNSPVAAPSPGLMQRSISVGGGSTCGVTMEGTAFCWGYNAFGKLGDGTTTQRDKPVLVAAPPGVMFTQVVPGANHTCGVTAAGGGYCWGSNDFGKLGDGTQTNRLTPVQVAAPMGENAAQFAPGGRHTCGITVAQVAYCWGENSDSQLGGGSFLDQFTPFPVTAPAGVTFRQVATGAFHSCGVTPQGAAYCWGSNGEGQLGDGVTFLTRNWAELVAAPAGVTFVEVATGREHSCGLTTAGTAYCWGDNRVGQLGDGTAASRRLTPVLVAVPNGVTFTQITTGTGHACGLTPAGEAYCWGSNAYGQLGDGTTTTRLTPVRVAVPNGVTFVQITATSGAHTCGLTPAGAAYCWGDNRFGQLGDGTVTLRLTPTPVAGGIVFRVP